MIESGTVLTSCTRFDIENVSLIESLRLASVLILFALFKQELKNNVVTIPAINTVVFLILFLLIKSKLKHKI